MLQTDYAKGNAVAPTPDEAGDHCSYRAEIDLAAAQVTNGQIIEMGPLPAGCDFVDAVLDTDDLDSNGTPTLTADVGLMSGDFGVVDGARTCGNEIFDGDTKVQSGGVARPSLATAFRVARSDTNRGIGIKLATAAATAAAGKIGLTVIYRG